MPFSVGDAVLKLGVDKGDLDRGMSQATDSIKNGCEKMKGQLRAVGAAFTAVGVAGLKMASDARKMNAELGVTAITVGITTKEMRALALEITNVTFSIKEVISTLDLLARAGVTDTEILKSTATAFDTLGDATGVSASLVTQYMIPAMKTFGLTAEEMSAKLDSMTYLARKTTMSLEDFNRMIGYTTPELVGMGLTIEDMLAILIHMERQGFAPGIVMTREFQKAVTQATKEQIPLTEAIGLTADELAGYKTELDGATGLTQQYADEANKQYGIMDELKQKWSEISFRIGSYLEPFEGLLAIMTVLGPTFLFMSTSMGVATVSAIAHAASMLFLHPIMLARLLITKALIVAQWLLNAAMAASPVGLIAVAIAALIAVGVLLIKNWDRIKAAFTRVWGAIVRGFKAVWDAIVGVVKEHWDKILFILFPAVGIVAMIVKNWEKVKEVTMAAWNAIADFFRGIWDSITGIFETAIDKVTDFFKAIPDTIGSAFRNLKNIILAPFRAAMSGIEAFVNFLIDCINKIHVKIPDWVPGIGGKEIGFDISHIKLPKFATGGLITEPTLLYGLRSQRPYGIAGEAGTEVISPAGASIINNFHIAQLVVREEADVRKVALELHKIQRTTQREMGVRLT